MKVLEINSVCGIGSTGRICADIADLLLARGDDCLVAYGREDCAPRCAPYAVRVSDKKAVYAHALRARLTDGMGLYSRRATADFIRRAEQYNPDVIHLHNLHGYYINVPLLFDYLARAGKPVLWTLHDCWPFTGHCAYFTARGCDKWRTSCASCPCGAEYPARLLNRSQRNYALKRALFTRVQDMTLVSPSRWLSELTRASFLSKYPVRVIPNGVDLSVFRPTESDFRAKNGLENKIIVLGVASAWDARKGYNDFLRLAAMLDARFRIVLVGLTEKQKTALPPGVTGITRTNDARELAQLYTAADVLFNPTYEDNYPTVNLEAQACGTDVLTYDTGGSRETLLISRTPPIKTGDLAAARDILLARGAWEKLPLSPAALRPLDAQAAFGQYADLLRARAGALTKGC